MKRQKVSIRTRRRHLNLLGEMVRSDFKLRYQNSALGYAWSLLKPLFMFAILYTVFAKFLKFGEGVPNYALSLLLGIVIWTFFADATTGAMKSIVGKGSLIRKIAMPRYLIPLASIIAALINMFLSLIIVVIFLLFADINGLGWETILFFPLLIIELLIVTTGVSFLLATAYVKFRDLEYIWDVIRQALFYTLPIIYPLTKIPYENIQKLIMLNPLAQIIQDLRSIITFNGTTRISDLFDNPLVFLIPISISFLIFYIGIQVFRSRSSKFAEDV